MSLKLRRRTLFGIVFSLVLIFVTRFVFVVAFSSSDAYKAAREFAFSNHAVLQEIGQVKGVRLISGRRSLSSVDGHVEVSMEVVGQRRSGKIFMALVERQGAWTPISAMLVLDDSRTIKLLSK